jgi:hypothetical protein
MGDFMTQANVALAKLIARAEGADPANRIDLRDEIAAHGSDAIDAVTPWLKVPALAAFAIRVIARAGLDGNREAAQTALRQARRRLDTRLRADVDWALATLKVPRPTPVATTPSVSRTSPRRVEAPRYAGGTRSLRARPRSSLSASS